MLSQIDFNKEAFLTMIFIVEAVVISYVIISLILIGIKSPRKDDESEHLEELQINSKEQTMEREQVDKRYIIQLTIRLALLFAVIMIIPTLTEITANFIINHTAMTLLLSVSAILIYICYIKWDEKH